MSNGWTDERKARQSQSIQDWKPWESSTGPQSPEGKARVRMNGYRGAKRERSRALARVVRDLLTSQVRLLAEATEAVDERQEKASD